MRTAAFVGFTAALSLLAPRFAAASYIYQTIDVPGINGNTYLHALNNSGELVGSYLDSSNVLHGFTDIGNNLATYTVPAAATTAIWGVNNLGNFVGYYQAKVGDYTKAYVNVGGMVTTLIPDASASSTSASDITDAGQVVGSYSNQSGTHGFIYKNGAYTTVDYPGGISGSTNLTGVSSSGVITGTYRDTAGIAHGFTYNSSVFTPLDVVGQPGGSSPYDINASGTTVGIYVSTVGHAYVMDGGTTTSLNLPGEKSSIAYSINDLGQISGYFQDSSGYHGFLATPASDTAVPEPSSLAILAVAVGSAGVVRRRRSRA